MDNAPTRREITHHRIVASAARAIRRAGYAGVGVADIMKYAGLTHGGFYAHFASRDALLVEAIERAGRDSATVVAANMTARRAKGASALRALVESYLADSQLARAEEGCPVAALCGEMPRQAPEVREASAERVRGLLGLVQQTLPSSADAGSHLAVTSTLVGALQLARALGDNAQGKSLLAASRKALLAQYDHA